MAVNEAIKGYIRAMIDSKEKALKSTRNTFYIELFRDELIDLLVYVEELEGGNNEESKQ